MDSAVPLTVALTPRGEANLKDAWQEVEDAERECPLRVWGVLFVRCHAPNSPPPPPKLAGCACHSDRPGITTTTTTSL